MMNNNVDREALERRIEELRIQENALQLAIDHPLIFVNISFMGIERANELLKAWRSERLEHEIEYERVFGHEYDYVVFNER